MAVAEMKKLRLLALRKDKSALLKKLQRLGAVEVVPAEDAIRPVPDTLSETKLAELQARVSRLDLAIARLTAYDKNKRGMLSLPPEADKDAITGAEAARNDTMAVVERAEEIERLRGELRARESRDKAQLETVSPWEGLEIPLDKLGEGKNVSLLALTLPAKEYEAFEASLSELPATRLEKLSEGREGVNLLLVSHRSDGEALKRIISERGAARPNFQGLTGTAIYNAQELREKLKEIDAAREKLRKEFEGLAQSLPEMRLLRDVEAAERDRLLSAGSCLNTRSAFLLTGWIPADRAGEVLYALKTIAPECQVEFSDPLPDEKPPTVLRNKTLVRPFESIVKLFSLPDPNGVDPTFMMMPFWICFFGMMVSDAGYGIVLGAGAAFIYCKLRGRGSLGQMSFVLALGGLSTVFWGAMYGGWFGETWRPVLFAPMSEPISMLILCLGVGCVHLLCGIGMAAYMNIKRKKYLDALYDQGFWVMLLLGLGLLLVNGTLGAILSIGGAVGILFTASRAGSGKNILKRVIGGLGALYGVTGYVSDVLSYARLFGMGLATGVIGMVVNTLASMLWGGVGSVFAVLVLIFGHSLNLAINALGAYVHSCRLQYIEFFNKFYESGGKDFHPLAVNSRYVDLKEN